MIGAHGGEARRGGVRVGLVGAGSWGKNYIETLRDIAGCDLVAVASRNDDLRAFLPPHCALLRDWHELLARDGIDGVIVATPAHTHAKIVVAALDAGKAVLVEKPLTLSITDAHAIVDAAQSAGRPVLVGHTHLFHPGFSCLRAELVKYGPIRGIRSSAGNHGPYRTDVSVLWDWGPHDVAMAMALVGTALNATSAKYLERMPIGDAVGETIQLHLAANAVPIAITLSNMQDRHRWFAVDFEAATLMYRDRGAAALTLYKFTGARPEQTGVGLPVSAGLPLTAEVAAFVALVAAGDASHDSLALGVGVTDILTRCEALLSDG